MAFPFGEHPSYLVVGSGNPSVYARRRGLAYTAASDKKIEVAGRRSARLSFIMVEPLGICSPRSTRFTVARDSPESLAKSSWLMPNSARITRNLFCIVNSLSFLGAYAPKVN